MGFRSNREVWRIVGVNVAIILGVGFVLGVIVAVVVYRSLK